LASPIAQPLASSTKVISGYVTEVARFVAQKVLLADEINDKLVQMQRQGLFATIVQSAVAAETEGETTSTNSNNNNDVVYKLPHAPFFVDSTSTNSQSDSTETQSLNEENSMFTNNKARLASLTLRSFAITMSRQVLYGVATSTFFTQDQVLYFERYLDLLVAHYITKLKRRLTAPSTSSSPVTTLEAQQSSGGSTQRGYAPSNKYPDDLTDYTGWGGYGIYVLIIFLIPLIVGLLAWLVMLCFCCFRCAGFCGGDKPTTEEVKHKGFSKSEQRIMILPYCILFILIV